MGRQTTDNTTRYWRRIPWPDEQHLVDAGTFPDIYHATWKLTGAARCGRLNTRLSATEYIQVEPGTDFLEVDPRVCPWCKALADANPQITQMEAR